MTVWNKWNFFGGTPCIVWSWFFLKCPLRRGQRPDHPQSFLTLNKPDNRAWLQLNPRTPLDPLDCCRNSFRAILILSIISQTNAHKDKIPFSRAPVGAKNIYILFYIYYKILSIQFMGPFLTSTQLRLVSQFFPGWCLLSVTQLKATIRVYTRARIWPGEWENNEL